MTLISNTLQTILDYPVIPVYYHQDPDTCIQVLEACYEGGIRVFEFTNRGEQAPENFKALLAYRNDHFKDLNLGIGTIKTAQQAKDYISAGADFIVSPIVKEAVAQVAAEHGIFWIPGCMTPTEISFAEELGAQLIKLFPGDTLGAGFLKAIKPLFPALKFMPTGGVDLSKSNVEGWLDAGVSALGFGSKLFSNDAGATGYTWLSERCKSLLEITNRK